MDLDHALSLARANRNGILITHRSDGRAQPSNIIHMVGDDGLIRISITADRAKYANLERDARCELYIGRDDFWAYAVLDCDCELAPVAAEPDDATVEELVMQYRAMAGEHPDWDEYRQTMVKDKRTIVRLHPTRAFGMWPTD